jgi:FkbM family methyltransferase
MASGMFEPFETRVIRELLPQIDIFINVGANIGYYCCHALSLGKPTIAVEPITSNLQYLLNNVKSNGWDKQIQVFPVALGESHNVLDIWGVGTAASLIKGWGSNPKQYPTRVPVLTLDKILGEDIIGKKALILIDVEGAEYLVLKGAIETLQNTPKPIWIIEITTTEHQPTEVVTNPHFKKTFELFFNLGYRAFTVEENPREIFKRDVNEIIANKISPGVHNFVFRSKHN